VGGAPGGWQEARDGLRRLVRRAPGEVRYRLALAKLLTYRDETRREGVGMLAVLARDPTIGKDAATSWRQALLWLSPTDRDVPLFREWLKAHPRDAEVARHLERARNATIIRDGFAALDRGDLREAQRLFDLAGNDPDAVHGRTLIAGRRAAQAKKSGFAALARGDLTAAEAYFRSIPPDADTRLGLALVLQKQAAQASRKEDFQRARDLLERARRLAPERRDVWERQLQSVVFWSRLRDASIARDDGRDNDAEASLRAAIDGALAEEAWHARLALANLMMESGRPGEAEANLRAVLGAVPDQPVALRALASLLVRQQRFEEAIPLNDRLLKVAPQSAYRSGWLRAESLRAAAAKSRQAHDLLRAREQLTQARDADASDVWVLHDLANVLLQLNALPEAENALAALLRAAPELPEARVTQARVLAARRQDVQALAILRALSPPSRDPAVLALRRRLEFQVRIPPALELAITGRREEAVRELEALEAEARGQPELVAQLAVAWSKLGNRPKAVELMRDAMARAPAATRAARLELASTLLDAGDDAFLGEILRGLEQDPSLTPTERRSLGELRVGHAVRLADRQRDEGNLRGAIRFCSALWPGHASRMATPTAPTRSTSRCFAPFQTTATRCGERSIPRSRAAISTKPGRSCAARAQAQAVRTIRACCSSPPISPSAKATTRRRCGSCVALPRSRERRSSGRRKFPRRASGVPSPSRERPGGLPRPTRRCCMRRSPGTCSASRAATVPPSAATSPSGSERASRA